ncbi:MAG: hypothetical protein GY711_34185 [bacterium]|nr:hypothetical protein [bacterium]
MRILSAATRWVSRNSLTASTTRFRLPTASWLSEVSGPEAGDGSALAISDPGLDVDDLDVDDVARRDPLRIVLGRVESLAASPAAIARRASDVRLMVMITADPPRAASGRQQRLGAH